MAYAGYLKTISTHLPYSFVKERFAALTAKYVKTKLYCSNI